MKLSDEQALYVRSMGKALRVTALFTDEKRANEHMARHPDEAVVAVFKRYILLANVHDKGVCIQDAPAPTPDELRALRLFISAHGNRWKRELAHRWESGRSMEQPGGALLQAMRNRLGPTWLKGFRAPRGWL